MARTLHPIAIQKNHTRAVHKWVFHIFLKNTAEKTRNRRNTGVHLALEQLSKMRDRNFTENR